MFPVALFSGVLAAYVGFVVLLLAVPLPVGVILAVPCGTLMGMLFIIGHDAAHNSFTSSRLLNHMIGRLAFLPSLHSFSLWDLSHNRTHHLYNNLRGVDYVWEPMTPREYRARGIIRRAIYRFYRTPFGVPFYYLVTLWLRRLFVPWPFLFVGAGRVVWLDSVLVVGFLALQIIGVVAVGEEFDKDPWTSVVVGLLLPFLVLNGFISMIIFLHHTHPAIEWYADKGERETGRGGLRGSTRVILPEPLRLLVLGIMDHNAHHFASGVPLYHVSRMQAALEAREELVTWRLSAKRFAHICRECKLYDYDGRRWVTFKEEDA